jgi:hypothetical protein
MIWTRSRRFIAFVTNEHTADDLTSSHVPNVVRRPAKTRNIAPSVEHYGLSATRVCCCAM